MAELKRVYGRSLYDKHPFVSIDNKSEQVSSIDEIKSLVNTAIEKVHKENSEFVENIRSFIDRKLQDQQRQIDTITQLPVNKSPEKFKRSPDLSRHQDVSDEDDTDGHSPDLSHDHKSSRRSPDVTTGHSPDLSDDHKLSDLTNIDQIKQQSSSLQQTGIFRADPAFNELLNDQFIIVATKVVLVILAIFLLFVMIYLICKLAMKKPPNTNTNVAGMNILK